MEENITQRSISISASIPLISDRPASPPRVAPEVRLKVASIAWAAALIAMGLGPASVMAEDRPVTAMSALRSATNGLWIGVGTEVVLATRPALISRPALN